MSFQLSDSEMSMFDAATDDLRIALDKLYVYRQADEQRFFSEYDRFIASANQFMTTALHIQGRRLLGNGSFAVLGYDIRRPETLNRTASIEGQSSDQTNSRSKIMKRVKGKPTRGLLTYIFGTRGKSTLALKTSDKNGVRGLRTRIFHDGAEASEIERELRYFYEVVVCWPQSTPPGMPVPTRICNVNFVSVSKEHALDCSDEWMSFLKDFFPHHSHTEICGLMHTPDEYYSTIQTAVNKPPSNSEKI